jgi:hypothetical protein
MFYYKKINYSINSESLNIFFKVAEEDIGYDTKSTKYSRVKFLKNDSHLLDTDPFLRKIKEKYTGKFSYMIFKSPPNYFINFHIDSKRSFGLNIPITNGATAFFGECDNDYFDLAVSNKKCPSFWDIKRLDYEVGVPYLVNTSVYHSIMNYNNINRYMLTFTFFGVNIDELVTELKQFDTLL